MNKRNVEATIDIAMYIISVKKLGIPQNSRDAFEVLNHSNLIDNQMLEKLKAIENENTFTRIKGGLKYLVNIFSLVK